MKLETKRPISKAVMVAALFCMTTQPTLGALLNLAQQPLFTGTNIPPKVMLTISKDQQLFKKAYNDYTDLDPEKMCGNVPCPDGIETTYKHTIDYYGYFDPKKCYKYKNGSDQFEPERVSATKLCGGSNEWSGNFLNWASMSRMDAVRKLLYGGTRSTDGGVGGDTVLERAYLPTDAHAWAKHYNPPVVPTTNQPAVSDLTPFNTPSIPTTFAATTGAFTIPPATGDYIIPFSSSQSSRIAPGDQIRLNRTAAPANFFNGAVLSIDGSGQNVTVRVNFASGVGGGGSDTNWIVSNLSTTGISFCNLTKGGGGANQVSTTNTQPPLIRVAQGNFGLWNANERWQCYWSDEKTGSGANANNFQGGFAGGLRSNGNQAALSEINASAENPIQNGGQAHSLGNGFGKGEFVVRVQVCKPGLVGSEKCKIYPSGNLKPIGLLQEFGDRDRIHFGLMTGSFAKNISGGVLRKNAGSIATGTGAEVRANTNGTFIEPYRPPNATRSVISPATSAGIINTLNYLRIYGYNYADGSYLGAAGDNCTYQLTTITENNCTSWGNPMSEVFFEAVRYFASPKDASTPPKPFPTAAYTYTTSGSKDNQLGLPTAIWEDPLSQAEFCAPLNIVVFNASVSSNEATTLTNPSDDLRMSSATAIGAGATDTIASLTNTVGTLEGITNGNYFVGKLVGSPGATATTDAGFELCTSKTITGLGDVSGICPEGPTTAGSYLMAGVAHHAHTKRIRSDLTLLDPLGDVSSLKVKTYGVQLATNVPQLVIQVPPVDANGLGKSTVVIQPIYRLDLGTGNYGGGAIVDMRFVKQDVALGTGKVYVNWEDSEQGGDYDQDMWGTIEWAVSGSTVKVTTNAISASTGNPQGFGYAISGTTQDGPHFHSGIYNFRFTDTTGALAQPANFAGCNFCNLSGSGGQVGPQAVTYQLGGTSAKTLQDPLWYAAKYGGFVDVNNNGVPDTTDEWDRSKLDGTPGADTVPDSYFLVTNPLGLETALARAFQAILKSGSGTALAANSTSASALTALYQAKFFTGDWSGQLLAYGFTPPGQTTLDPTPKWDAAATLATTTPDERTIITYNDILTARKGVKFRWPDVSTLTVGLELDKNPDSAAIDGNGENRLKYLRGDNTLETGPSAIFRQRSSKLGDIVDSSPIYVGAPSSNVLDVSYVTFRNQNVARTPMVYVGANDGMLHGFEASPTGTGKERLAYVPSKTFPNLSELTSPNYVHRYFVDGTPEVQDAFTITPLDPVRKWRTVLVGGLAGGGQGLYALDVTNPDGNTFGAPKFDEANADKIVLWEFKDSDDKALGFTYSKPLIRKMANGRWAAIVSGGYNNSEAGGGGTTGQAHLFIIFLDGPTDVGPKGEIRKWKQITSGNAGDYIKIPTGVGSLSTPNSLAPPFAADVNGDGLVDFVYAGDLEGNLWKFDVSNKLDTSAWDNSANRRILFTAKDPDSGLKQPITAQAEGTGHPTGKGFIITFGTGKYLEFTDTIAPYRRQTFYGIWDKNDKPGDIQNQTTVTNRNQLLAQTVEAEVASGTQVFRVVSNFAPVWSTDITPPIADDSPSAGRHMGWRLDFPLTDGERVVTQPLLQSGRLIFATSIPSNSTCSFGGSGWLMVLNPVTGGRIESAVLDVTGDGFLNTSDKVTSGGNASYASGVQLSTGLSGTPTVITNNSTIGTLYTPNQAGEPPKKAPIGIERGGRVTWREVLTP